MSSRQIIPEVSELDPIELRKIIPLKRVTELTSLSKDSLKRHHADKIRRLSPRCQGMSLGDALAIGKS
jgi:hypothetical protein